MLLIVPFSNLSTPSPDEGIPANFFWDISVRFLFWECWDFWRRHDHFRRFPKKSEDVRSLPKAQFSSPSLRTRMNSSSLPVLFASKIRDREEGIVIYSFYTWFSFLTWVWFNIFFGNCVKQDGNNSHFSIRREKLARKRETAWDRSFQPAGVRLTRKAWELAGITLTTHWWLQRVHGLYSTGDHRTPIPIIWVTWETYIKN